MADSKTSSADESLYQGLQALSNLSFPKKCSTCGKRYETVEAFISQTEALRHSSGLKEDIDDDEQIIVELFRNCLCGSTLMDEFSNRRDLSKAGIARRKKFQQLIERLSAEGYSVQTAREELLKIMRGQESEILNKKSK